MMESDEFSEENEEIPDQNEKMNEIYFYTDVDETKNFFQALKNKFNEIKIKTISLIPGDVVSDEELKENLLNNKNLH